MTPSPLSAKRPAGGRQATEWARLEKSSFLTNDEKRSSVGFGPASSKGLPDDNTYSPDQPRSEDGRWSNDNSGVDESENEADVVLVSGRKKGGIPKELYNMAVQQFAASYCKGRVKDAMPEDFDEITVGEMLKLAQGGDEAARTCKKLLEQSRFRK
jgi:hypothetical protein